MRMTTGHHCRPFVCVNLVNALRRFHCFKCHVMCSRGFAIVIASYVRVSKVFANVLDPTMDLCRSGELKQNEL